MIRHVCFLILCSRSLAVSSGARSGGSVNFDGATLKTEVAMFSGRHLTDQTVGLAASTRVNTTSGPIQGVCENGVQRFLGIPYAKPPLGNLRFRRAQVHDGWEEVRDASQYGPACPQTDTWWLPSHFPTSEDCLFVNVITPAPNGCQTTTGGTLSPVMVYIHGGGFVHGAGHVWNMSSYAREQNIVTATLNYRLGALGTLALEEFAQENASFPATGGVNFLYDQISALTWIKDNIERFGGDPKRIMVFGESAGGLSVCMLLSSPFARGLFDRAGIMSGPCNGPWGPGTRELGIALGHTFMEDLGITTAAELRNLSLSQLRSSLYYENISPTVDGFVLPASPQHALGSPTGLPGISTKSQILIGATSFDGLAPPPWNALRVHEPKNSEELFSNFERYFGALPEMHRAINQTYNPSAFAENATLAWLIANAEACVLCPIRALAKRMREDNGPDLSVSLYKYGYNPNNHDLSQHASELPAVFGYLQ